MHLVSNTPLSSPLAPSNPNLRHLELHVARSSRAVARSEMRAGSRKGPSAAPEAGPAVAEDAQRYYKPSFSVDPWQQLKDAPPRVWGQEAPAGGLVGPGPHMGRG